MFHVVIKQIRCLPAAIKWGVLVFLVLGSAACVQRFSPAGGAAEPADLLEVETNLNPTGIARLIPVLLFLP